MDEIGSPEDRAIISDVIEKGSAFVASLSRCGEPSAIRLAELVSDNLSDLQLALDDGSRGAVLNELSLPSTDGRAIDASGGFNPRDNADTADTYRALLESASVAFDHFISAK